MAHWRDGGIGNMPGSDDRPIEEWTLLEQLAAILNARVGAAAMSQHIGPHVWSAPIHRLAQAAFDEIQRLRDAPVQAAAARAAADRNAVIKECIDKLECQFAEHEKSNEAQGILHAMEFLESLKTPENGGGA